MRHAIIGSGVIGKATGLWLLANKQEVTFFDIKDEVLDKLKEQGYNTSKEVTAVGIRKNDPKIIWICTAEWDVDSVIQNIYEYSADKIFVIRSTMPPGEIETIAKKYGLLHIAHMPEFLRQNSATSDIFNKDRVIIGTNEYQTKLILKELLETENVPVIFTNLETAAVIKYAANCWLATQISFWNEIKKICDSMQLNPQEVANAVTLDKRISTYGSAMIGKPFSGFCFPKDMKTFIQAFEKRELDPKLLKAVVEVNDSVRK